MPPIRPTKALASTHAELVLIHPFRERTGRCARLLAVLNHNYALLEARFTRRHRGLVWQRRGHAQEAYTSALTEKLPEQIREVVQRQHDCTVRNHGMIRDARNSYKAQKGILAP